MPHQEDKVRWVQPVSTMQDGQHNLLRQVGTNRRDRQLLQRHRTSAYTRHRDPHKLRRRNFPQGYAEMLERQQGQLVAGINQLYQRLQTAGLWEQPLPGNLDGKPLTHDILAALDLLEPKGDGSGELEIFSDVVRPSSQPDNDTMPSVSDDDMDDRDRHDSIVGESKPTSLPSDDNRSPSPQIRNPEPSPGHAKQTPIQTSTTESPSPQYRNEYHESQAQLYNTLAATPVHRSLHDASSVPIQDAAIGPSLFLDPRAIRQPALPAQALSPLCYEWARRGITLDQSDFFTDFHQFGQFDTGRESSLVTGML
jgi:hypothetical protein